MMYDELVKSLRICGDWETVARFPGKDGCDGCAYRDEANDVCNSWDADNRKENIMLEAADAIEYLMRKLEAREAALTSLAGCLGDSTNATTDVLNTAEDLIT